MPMEPDLEYLFDLEWIITRIDGKIASVALDWRPLAALASKISSWPADRISCMETVKTGTRELMEISADTRWEDLYPVGSPFQRRVWERLFYLTHAGGRETPDGKQGGMPAARLVSYTDFAEMCGIRPGVRAVAHAVGLNPVPFIIPCHLVVPKEATDSISRAEKEAEASLFGKDWLCLDTSLDFGQFSMPGGKALKRDLIRLTFSDSMSRK